jgi:aerobic carbon-monoxide dehydrogenase small subunit
MAVEIEFVVNEMLVTVAVEPRWTLADVLRDQLGLTGTHLGCEYGICGACTVLLDGEPARACLLFAIQAHGHRVTTVESLGAEGHLHPLQEAFWEEHGLQCGFCTPGFLITSLHLLRLNPHPTRLEIREALEGNLCRCTGYQFIVNAVERAAEKLATFADSANETSQ